MNMDCIQANQVPIASATEERQTGKPGARLEAPTPAGNRNLLNTAAMSALLALVALATLVRGGNRHMAMLVLEWLSLATLLAMVWPLWRPGGVGDAPRVATVPVAGRITRVARVLLLSAPLWLVAWAWLPVLAGARPALQVPTATWSGLLLCLPMLACLVAGRWGTDAQVQTLAKAWLWVALVQALWGLLQVAGLDGLRFDAASREPAIGSFASKNTYSNLLVQALPLAVWRIAAARSARGRRHRAERAGWLTWGWVLALLVLLSVLLLGTSRTGIATGVLVLVLGLPWLLGQPSGRESPAGGLRRRWLLSGMAALLGLALVAAGWEWAARFEAGRLLADDATRALMRHTTWQAALAWWPWGSGPGTYANLYAAWQPPELGRYLIDMAHNDYLQLLMELGLAAVLLAAALMWLVAQRLRQGFATPAQADRGGRDMPALQKAAALGLLATALHAWVDYPFHIPANAMMACFLLGIFLKPPRQI